MGYRCRWVATRRRLDEVLRRFGFTVRTLWQEKVYDTGLYALALPGGWSVVIGDGWDAMEWVSRAHAESLSEGGEALYLFTDDSSMNAALVGFVDGRPAWSLDHHGEHARDDLEGEPPAVVHETLAARRAEAAAEASEASPPDGEEVGVVDVTYDAVADIALALIGFRHDATLSSGEHLPIAELYPPSTDA